MGAITSSIGLASGIDTASLIEQLLALESRTKLRLQSRLGQLQQQQTALLDINSRLLNFKTVSNAFRDDDIFKSTSGTSSNPDVLGVTAGPDAAQGSFTFIVKSRVTTSQQMSAGFATRDATPLGLESMSFEFGNGKVVRDTDLSDLNGGQGVRRGNIVITDSAGGEATVDLSDVVTLNEVIDRINGAEGVNVAAKADGNQLIVTDNSGGAGTFSIANGVGDFTATDLGIAAVDGAAGDQDSTADGVITGSTIYNIAGDTALASLNDGNGITTVNNVADMRLTARDGTVIDVDLGAQYEDVPITTNTLLSDLNDGAGVTISDDENNPDIRIIDRSDNTWDIDLTGVTTVGELAQRVDDQTEGRIQISITDGDKLTVTDTEAPANPQFNLRVQGAGTNGNETASDLGILNQSGVDADSFDGEVIAPSPELQQSGAQTIQEVLDRINNATGNDGKIVASVAANGLGLELNDTTGGAGNLIVNSTAANPYAAEELGLYTGENGQASSTIQGQQILASLSSVLVKSLNGGSGMQGADSITVNDRAGNAVTINGLANFATLEGLVDRINSELSDNAVDVQFSVNSAQTGIVANDSSGGAGNLLITGDMADALRIATDPAGVAQDSVTGENLQLQYVSQATALEDLNYGQGVGTGSFRIRDSFGEEAVINIGSDAKTLNDIINEINSRGLAINARINDNGDGLLIEEDLSDASGEPFTTIRVTNVNGTTASDLNILGEASEVSGSGARIDGSFEYVVDLDINDTMDDVLAKLKQSGAPVSASIVNAGGGPKPYRLNFTSGIGGAAGELVINTSGADLGIESLTTGRDARVFFGSENPEDAFLITSRTNSIDDVIDGVTLNLLGKSDEPITVTIERDTDAVVEHVKEWVAGFNDVIGRINDYDFFDVDTEKKGVLLGSAVTARVRQSLYRVQGGQARNIDGQYQFLSQAGIKIGEGGELNFDEQKFLDAYNADPQSMEELFAAFEGTTPGSTQEILPGVTVTQSGQNVTTAGFAELFAELLDDMTDSIDGTMALAGDSLDDQIELLNDRIEQQDLRLERRREQLEREFTAMELAISQFQSQAGSLNTLAQQASAAGSLFG